MNTWPKRLLQIVWILLRSVLGNGRLGVDRLREYDRRGRSYLTLLPFFALRTASKGSRAESNSSEHLQQRCLYLYGVSPCRV